MNALSLREFADRYDWLIHHPLLRAYFGPAGFYNAGYWTADTRTQEQACFHLIERLLPRVQTGRVLDVACGLGATTQELVRCDGSDSVCGINVSHRQLMDSRRRAPGAHFAVMDGAMLAFASGTFDTVVSVEAPFHFATRRRFLEESRRVLRPGGSLVVTDILFQSRSWAGSWTVPEDNYLSGVDAYRAMLHACGFGDIEIEDVTGPSWQGFCAHLTQWIKERHTSGDLDHADAVMWDNLSRQLAENAVRSYLIVAAKAMPTTATPSEHQ